MRLRNLIWLLVLSPALLYAQTQVTGPTIIQGGAPGPQGPTGSQGVAGPNCAVASPPATCNVTGDMNVTGNVAAGISVFAPTIGNHPTGSGARSNTVPVVIGQLQALHPAALRSTLTKTQAMALNTGGYPGYTSPAQLYLMQGGDSTGGFHSNAVTCTLMALYGIVGYINTAPGGNATLTGYPCPTPFGFYFSPTFAGGATAVSNDFNHFPGGQGYSIPSGGTITNANGVYSTRQLVFYTADAPATVTVNISTDGTTFNPLSGCTSVALTAGVGAVCDQTLAYGWYMLQVSASAGTVYVWTAGQADTTHNGVVAGSMSVAGTSLPNQASVPIAITQPWWNAIHPDLTMFEMKNNGTMVQGYPQCTQATSAAPTVGQSRSYWWNKWIAPMQTANALTDVVIFGSYDITGADTNAACIPIYNQVEQAWAYAQQPEQTYVDNYWQLTNAQMQALGWIGTDVHQYALGQVAHSMLDLEYLGIMNWATGAAARDIQAPHYVQAPKISIIGNSPQVQCWPASGQIGTTPSTDCGIVAGRGIVFQDAAGHTNGFLASAQTGYGAANNWLAPFQLSDTSGTTNSGKWLAVASGLPGIYAGAAGTAVPWSASTYGYSFDNPAPAGNLALDQTQFRHRIWGISGNVTGQTYANTAGLPIGRSSLFTLQQGATARTWVWSGTNQVYWGGMRVPQFGYATCAQRFYWENTTGVNIPEAPAVCYVGSGAGQGDSKTVVLADALMTGTSANVDGAGELSISAATTVSYTFTDGTMTVHDECWAVPQFDIGSGNRMWITYTAATSFTVNFATAVTGTISYGCTKRT